MDQFNLYLQYHKEIAQAKLKIIERFEQQARSPSQKRTSNIDIVQNVLNSAGQPLQMT